MLPVQLTSNAGMSLYDPNVIVDPLTLEGFRFVKELTVDDAKRMVVFCVSDKYGE
jgi:hypothetical protein